jgi:hypothetical protein
VSQVQRGGTPGPTTPARGCRRVNVCSSRWQAWCYNTGSARSVRKHRPGLDPVPRRGRTVDKLLGEQHPTPSAPLPRVSLTSVGSRGLRSGVGAGRLSGPPFLADEDHTCPESGRPITIRCIRASWLRVLRGLLHLWRARSSRLCRCDATLVEARHRSPASRGSGFLRT